MRNLCNMAVVMMALIFSVTSVEAAEYVGYNKIDVPANSDARLTVPFSQDLVSAHVVEALTGTGVTVSDTLAAGVLAETHYARFVTGDASGLFTTISDNGTGSIDFADADVLALVSAGDEFRVYKHHTLSTVFPKGFLGISFVNGTQVLLYVNDINNMVLNKSAARVAIFNNGNWVGAGVNNNTILEPETQFIVRNTSSQELTVFTKGDAPDFAVSKLIAANGDLVLGSGYPLPVALKEAGIDGNLRQVLFFDNTATGINKSASKVAISNNGNWVGAGVTGNELINPSESITLRLPANETGTKVTFTKPY